MISSTFSEETNRDAAIVERLNRRYNQPGLYEMGLETLANAQPTTSADIRTLAADFEAAWAAESVIFKSSCSDAEADASTSRVREVARKIVAIPATDLAMMRLKARVYLWSQSTDFETFSAENEGKGWSESVLASLFRDLGADRPIGSITAPAPDPVFAAIAQHIVARNALIEAIPRTDKVTAKREGREVTKADEDAVEALNLDEEAAFLELFVIVPTTLEGRRALLQHFVQRDEDGISDPIGEIAASLLPADVRPRGGAHMNACTDREKTDLLAVIAQRIEQRERLDREFGDDLRRTLRLPDLEELKRGLEILQRELARPQR